VDWLIAERPGKVKPEAASAQEQNGHQHRIHESQHPCQGGAPVSHHQAAVRLVKARYKGLLKNDNQLAMLFTLANLFRVDQMIRQWERSQ
jgi:IS5 family transposase